MSSSAAVVTTCAPRSGHLGFRRPPAPMLFQGLSPHRAEASAPHLTLHGHCHRLQAPVNSLSPFHPGPVILINGFSVHGHLGQHPQLSDSNLLNSATVVGRSPRSPSMPGPAILTASPSYSNTHLDTAVRAFCGRHSRPKSAHLKMGRLSRWA